MNFWGSTGRVAGEGQTAVCLLYMSPSLSRTKKEPRYTRSNAFPFSQFWQSGLDTFVQEHPAYKLHHYHNITEWMTPKQ